MLRLSGRPASPGSVTGRLVAVVSSDQVPTIESGDIVAVRHSNPRFVGAVVNAAGVLCETGGVGSHVASICRELNLPCVVDIEGIVDLAGRDSRVTLNGATGEVILLRPHSST